MEIWLRNDSYNIRFPVLPASYSLKRDSNNTSVNVNALGEVNLIGNKKLQTVEFATLFPFDETASYCDITPEYKPTEYLEIFKTMQESGVCTLTMTGCNITMQCTIESLNGSEEDGTGDMMISFSFREYIKPGVKKKKTKKGKAKSARTNKKVKGGTYTVKKNDCLSAIAQKQTGKAANWQTIYADNKTTIGANPNNLKVGIKLSIRANY